MKPTWQKATPTEHQHLIVKEVHHQEAAARYAKAISHAKQGYCIRWEGIERRKITWNELWSIKSNRLNFIKATYDILPSPTNINLWLGDLACPLCAVLAPLRAHLGWLQDQPNTRQIPLVMQPGVEVFDCWTWAQEIKHQWPDNGPTTTILHPGWRETGG